MLEIIAQNSHELWAKNKIDQGFVYGTKSGVNSKVKCNKHIVPYETLPAKDRLINRNHAKHMLKAMLGLGFKIIPPKKPASELRDLAHYDCGPHLLPCRSLSIARVRTYAEYVIYPDPRQTGPTSTE